MNLDTRLFVDHVGRTCSSCIRMAAAAGYPSAVPLTVCHLLPCLTRLARSCSCGIFQARRQWPAWWCHAGAVERGGSAAGAAGRQAVIFQLLPTNCHTSYPAAAQPHAETCILLIYFLCAYSLSSLGAIVGCCWEGLLAVVTVATRPCCCCKLPLQPPLPFPWRCSTCHPAVCYAVSPCSSPAPCRCYIQSAQAACS